MTNCHQFWEQANGLVEAACRLNLSGVAHPLPMMTNPGEVREYLYRLSSTDFFQEFREWPGFLGGGGHVTDDDFTLGDLVVAQD